MNIETIEYEIQVAEDELYYLQRRLEEIREESCFGLELEGGLAYEVSEIESNIHYTKEEIKLLRWQLDTCDDY